MATLATVQSVAYRLGEGSVDSFQDTSTLDRIYSSLTGATVRLSAILMTEFDRATRTDIYYVDSDEHPYKDQFPKLQLKQGFVDSTKTYEVRLATVHSDLPSEGVLDTQYIIRADEQGMLLITGSDEFGKFTLPFSSGSFFVQADYTAGFLTEADENFGYVYKDVPSWLQEAAVSLASHLFKTYGNCDKDECAAGTLDIGRILEPHIRFYPSALKPLI